MGDEQAVRPILRSEDEVRMAFEAGAYTALRLSIRSEVLAQSVARDLAMTWMAKRDNKDK